VLRAIFFDFNGVLVDDEAIHFKTFHHVLKEEGIDLTEEEYFATYLARDDRGCFTHAMKTAGKPMDQKKLDELIAHKSAFYDEEIEKDFTIFPSADLFVRKCAQKYPIGLVSGALRGEINYVLKEIKLDKIFTVIISTEDVESSKPDPECYEKALLKVNEARKTTPPIQPSECLVFEDAVGGIKSAKDAGMKCVALLNTYNQNDLKAADLCIQSFNGIDLAKIEKIF
jgi:beta-phosphoglucomutase